MKQELLVISTSAFFSVLRPAKVSMITPNTRFWMMMMMTRKKKVRS